MLKLLASARSNIASSGSSGEKSSRRPAAGSRKLSSKVVVGRPNRSNTIARAEGPEKAATPAAVQPAAHKRAAGNSAGDLIDFDADFDVDADFDNFITIAPGTFLVSGTDLDTSVAK